MFERAQTRGLYRHDVSFALGKCYYCGSGAAHRYASVGTFRM